jgi:pyruvate formate lyase activating enzyme
VYTSGFAPEHVLLEMAQLADLVLYDIKLIDSEAHQRFTGVPNMAILENLRRLSAEGVRLEIRMPMIPGITDTPANIEATVTFICSLPHRPAVRLLAHHHAAMSKYHRFGMEHTLGELKDPSAGQMADIAARLRRSGIEAFV